MQDLSSEDMTVAQFRDYAGQLIATKLENILGLSRTTLEQQLDRDEYVKAIALSGHNGTARDPVARQLQDIAYWLSGRYLKQMFVADVGLGNITRNNVIHQYLDYILRWDGRGKPCTRDEYSAFKPLVESNADFQFPFILHAAKAFAVYPTHFMLENELAGAASLLMSHVTGRDLPHFSVLLKATRLTLVHNLKQKAMVQVLGGEYERWKGIPVDKRSPIDFAVHAEIDGIYPAATRSYGIDLQDTRLYDFVYKVDGKSVRDTSSAIVQHLPKYWRSESIVVPARKLPATGIQIL